MRFFGAATYSAEISGPVDDYRRRRLPADRTGALMMTAIGISGAVASAVQVTWLEYLLAGCAIAGLLLALRGHARSAAILRTAVQQAHSAPRTEPPPQTLPPADGDLTAP